MEKNNKYLLLTGIISGVLLWLSWPAKPFTFLIFIALIPLLYISDYCNKHSVKGASKVFFSVYVAMLIWNSLTSFWIYKATLPGAIATVILNSLMMTLPFVVYHKMQKAFKHEISFAFLVIFWISIEYLFLNWDLAWPWLNLGNVFSETPYLVQWYEYTGSFGGTLWIWIINISIYKILVSYIGNFGKKSVSDKRKNYLIALGFLIIPVVISLLIKVEPATEKAQNIVIVQPNIDPYNEKFAGGTFENQLEKMLFLTSKEIDSNTMLVVWPETALSIPFDEENIKATIYYQQIENFFAKYPKASLLTGIDSYRFFEKDEKISTTARFYPYDSTYYDAYNAALLLNPNRDIEFYHKSILVPGVEKMPYPNIFKFISKLSINLGGTSGSLGKQEEPSVFKVNEELIVAPVICYESVFGEYVGKFVQKDANILAVITNDGWWGNTPGHRQHFQYARLRAIEHRKYVVRSANTGISGFIDSKGMILKKTEFWYDDVFKVPVLLDNTKTFYSINGDYIGRIASFLSVLLILLSFSRKFIKREIPGLG